MIKCLCDCAFWNQLKAQNLRGTQSLRAQSREVLGPVQGLAPAQDCRNCAVKHIHDYSGVGWASTSMRTDSEKAKSSPGHGKFALAERSQRRKLKREAGGWNGTVCVRGGQAGGQTRPGMGSATSLSKLVCILTLLPASLAFPVLRFAQAISYNSEFHHSCLLTCTGYGVGHLAHLLQHKLGLGCKCLAQHFCHTIVWRKSQAKNQFLCHYMFQYLPVFLLFFS